MSVILGTVELKNLTAIEVDEQVRVVRHPVPGLDGDLSQLTGRPSMVVRLAGIFYGDESTKALPSLRAAHLAGEPVDFFTEAVGEGYMAQVLITRLHMTQRAAFPDQYDFFCEVVEFVKPKAPSLSAPLSGIETNLVQEAKSYMDSIQNGMAQARDAVHTATALSGVLKPETFSDPTSGLGGMVTIFTAWSDNARRALGGS